MKGLGDEYTFIDHRIFRTEKGAKGQLIVEGQENLEIYIGKMQAQI